MYKTDKYLILCFLLKSKAKIKLLSSNFAHKSCHKVYNNCSVELGDNSGNTSVTHHMLYGIQLTAVPQACNRCPNYHLA